MKKFKHKGRVRLVGEALTVEDVDRIMEELQKHKMKLLLGEGKAFRCQKCGKIIMKNTYYSYSGKDGLCFECWGKEVRQERREKLLKLFSQAKIVDIEPRDDPFSNIFEVDKIIIEVDDKYYEIKASRWNELYIEIEKIKKRRKDVADKYKKKRGK